MRRQSALALLAVLIATTAAAWYYSELYPRAFATPLAAIADIDGNMDSRQRERANILPHRVIDLPLIYNLPDRVAYVTLFQPSVSDGDTCLLDISSTGMPPQSGINDPLCSWGLGNYEVLIYPTSLFAHAAYTALDARQRATAYLLSPPIAPGTPQQYLVVRQRLQQACQ